MAFFHSPNQFQILLDSNAYADDIYKALEKDDISEVVMTSLDVLRKTGSIPLLPKQNKCNIMSDIFRTKGNEAYKMKMFRETLVLYNKALMYAPERSHMMKLAYSNRAALLLTLKAYKACLIDIDTVISMGVSNDQLKEKLEKRRKDCKEGLKANIITESMHNYIFQEGFSPKFFKFHVKRHPNIPCASTDVDVVMEDCLPKIVAAKNIRVGTVVALESPYVCHLQKSNYSFSCYRCHKISLNLIPCNKCCFVMFCDAKCRSLCQLEYHHVECQIMEYLEEFTALNSRLKTKAVIKMRQMCHSWEEFIAASKTIGIDRMTQSSINEIYDGRNKFSILNFNSPRHMVLGESYNSGFICATELHRLGQIPNYLPESKGLREEAMRALARIMLTLQMSYIKIEIENSAEDVNTENVSTDTVSNQGWYAFTSKLKHCCDANLLAVGIKNKIALVALHPIQKGTELTISYLGHWYEHMYINEHGNFRRHKLFAICQEICTCRVCVENWNSLRFTSSNLTREQKRAYQSLIELRDGPIIHSKDQKLFKAACEAMTVFHNAPNTAEHHEIYGEFRKLVNFCQYIATGNVTVL